MIDVVKALAKRGFREEAENLLNVVKLRLSGDYLQTSAMIRNGRIVSAVNDPERLSRSRLRLSRVRRTAAAAQRHPRCARSEGSAALGSPARKDGDKCASAIKSTRRGAAGGRQGRCGHRHQPGLRLEAVPDDGRPSAFRSAWRHARCNQGARAQGPRRALSPHGRYLLPRSVRRAACRSAASASASRPRARPSSISATASRTTISNCFPMRRSPGSSTTSARRQCGRLCAGRNAGAHRGAAPGRGHGFALPRPRRPHLRHRNRADRGRCGPEEVDVTFTGAKS